MSTFSDKLAKILAGNMTGDAVVAGYTQSQIADMQSVMAEEVMARYIEAGQSVQTPREAYNDVLLHITGDEAGAFNDKLGYGTLADPMQFTRMNIPVTFGPTEAAAVYSTGGLASDIIDKKSRSMILKGVTFKTQNKELWKDDAIEKLEAAAQETGLNGIGGDAITDAFLQGGSVLYPVFKTDTPRSLNRPLDKMSLEKGCIERWVETDRWNVTWVPNFIVTAADYLHPKQLLIPMSDAVIDTSRAALLRPKSLPYWASLYNLGWCPSDLSGWIRAYYAYEVTMMSIPVMAQQMSLLLYRMPLDGLNATVGPKGVKDLMAVNEEAMSRWNSLSPKAVNMVGEVEVVNRTYSGLDHFLGAVKSELSAQCGLPEPSLWHTPNKGFSDNTNESLLKASEALQMSQSVIERAMNPVRDALVAHVFGTGSAEWENRNTIRLTFDKPVISTEKDLAEVGARFAASVNSFTAAGVSPDVAIELSKPFFPSIHVTDEMIAAAKKSYDEQQAHEEKVAATRQANSMGGGKKSSGGQMQQTAQTGHGTKGGKA